MTHDILLQVGQVLTVLVLAPLLQGVILQWEERVQRAQGPGIFQPYRDLWKLFHKQGVAPQTASFIYWIAPVVSFTCMLTVPILIPVLTNFPLPLSDMGDILGGGFILTLGSFLITLAGLCRFKLTGETAGDTPYRIGQCDFSAFAGDMAENSDDGDFPREHLLAALRDYLNNRDMKADWKSVTSAPPEALVNALAMMCPFEPAEKQALLEAPSFGERVSTLVALLEMAGPDSGPQTLN